MYESWKRPIGAPRSLFIGGAWVDPFPAATLAHRLGRERFVTVAEAASADIERTLQPNASLRSGPAAASHAGRPRAAQDRARVGRPDVTGASGRSSRAWSQLSPAGSRR